MTLATLLVLASATLALGQRPFFAGSKPIGYPEIATTEGLGNRFGESDGTTQRLPLEANGDRELVDRLSKLPIDKQPFWLINWQALEANRQKPQTYPQKPNPFADGNQFNGGSSSGNVNSNFGIPSSNSGNSSPTSSPATTNAASVETASAFASSNRFGAEEYPSNIKDNRFENAFTNSNPSIGHSNSGRIPSSAEKNPSSKDKKPYN